MTGAQVIITPGDQTIVASTVQDPNNQVVVSAVGVQGPPGPAGPPGPVGVTTQLTVAGTSYTLSETDRSAVIKFTAATEVAVTVPAGLSGLFDCMLVQLGSGQVVVSAGAGATVSGAFAATRTAYQYAVATLLPLGSDAYLLAGEVSA